MALACCMGLQKSTIKMIAEDYSVVVKDPVDYPEKWMSDYRTCKEFHRVGTVTQRKNSFYIR